jgi:hypothetical protein
MSMLLYVPQAGSPQRQVDAARGDAAAAKTSTSPDSIGFQYTCSMNTSFESAATTQEAAKPNILAIFGDDTQLLKV